MAAVGVCCPTSCQPASLQSHMTLLLSRQAMQQQELLLLLLPSNHPCLVLVSQQMTRSSSSSCGRTFAEVRKEGSSCRSRKQGVNGLAAAAARAARLLPKLLLALDLLPNCTSLVAAA